MSHVDDLGMITGWLPSEGSLSLAWAQAQDACPEGWSIRGLAEIGECRYQATAFGPDLHAHLPCRTCGQVKNEPTVLIAEGDSPALALDALAIKLRALA